MAVALVLLVGAGLLLRSFVRVLQADAGFRSEGVLTASVPLPRARFDTAEKRAAFAARLVEQLREEPGVRSAALTLPLLGGWQSSFSVEGRPEAEPGQMPSADITRVAGAYFEAMGVRLRSGRVFDARDAADAAKVAIVDDSFAGSWWPNQSPLGKRVKFGRLSEDEPWLEVVGVVAHVKNYGVDGASRVEIYLPYAQAPAGAPPTLLLRGDGDVAALASRLRQAVKAADPELPVYEIRTLDEIVAEATAPRRVAVMLISVFAALALVLAAVGIYGVMSYSVAQRTAEFGVRMALGAERRHILKMVLRHGGRMAAAGIAIGVVAALGLARLLAALLFQTSTTDPPTFSLVPLLLCRVAALACYVPALRATRVDPLAALRSE
jgi:putative ABC transport system permease protein